MSSKPFKEDLDYFFGTQLLSSEQYEDFCRYEIEPMGNPVEANEIVDHSLESGIYLNHHRMESLSKSFYSKMDDDFVRSMLAVEVGICKGAGHIVESNLQNFEPDEITNKDCHAEVERTDSKNVGCLSENENSRQKEIEEKIGVLSATNIAEIPRPARQSAVQKSGYTTELDVFGSLAAASQQSAAVSAIPRLAKRSRAATMLNADLAVAPKRGRGNRGAHVRERPDMQQAARDGAAHWLQQLRRVRADWAAAAQESAAFSAEFRAQADAAAVRVKAKLECLLRTLQLAAHAGLVTPLPAPPQPDEAREGSVGGSFFGWAGFAVHAARAAEFRAAVAGLFPAGFREETVRETFRRAGLVPAGWRWADGWCGAAPFVPVIRTSEPATPRQPQPGAARRSG
jgi:hypothetical protein